jgi:hypothetical protein
MAEGLLQRAVGRLKLVDLIAAEAWLRGGDLAAKPVAYYRPAVHISRLAPTQPHTELNGVGERVKPTSKANAIAWNPPTLRARQTISKSNRTNQ